MSDSGNPEEPAPVHCSAVVVDESKDIVSVESDEEMKNKDETEETKRKMEAEESREKDIVAHKDEVGKVQDDSCKINGILTNGSGPEDEEKEI